MVLCLVCVLLLLFCVLHDDQLLQIFNLLPHVANDLILPLNLRPEVQDFPLVASFLSLHLRFEVIVNPDNSILKHLLIAIQLLTYIPFQSLTKTSYHRLALSYLVPCCCYPLLLPSEAYYLLLYVLEQLLNGNHNVDFITFKHHSLSFQVHSGIICIFFEVVLYPLELGLQLCCS